ncbi:MAG: HU family DNA-binding protein [Alphaproteobacteria bacterium]|nr:HU family DNA-binding protein [Alphaproteobacteria bacterium]
MFRMPGVGQLKVAVRGARQVRHPQTGETITVPAGNAVKFKASKALKDAVNG